MPVITRFAPSPTGEPHIGNIRTALLTWLFARSKKGKFYMRIEDTDKTRESPGAVESILESLDWLGIDYDEIQNSKFKIQNSKFKNVIFQSHRLSVYKQYAEILVERGYAYACTCSPERLRKLREQQQKEGKPSMYDGCCRDTAISYNLQATTCKLKSYVIRLKVPEEGITEFTDLIRGKVTFENKLIDDQVLLKSDGYPTYHLANVVDDHEMGITHVIRGEDWLSSTPKHIFLYNFFDWEIPKFAHLPMILGKDKSKLSKRHGAVALLEYKRQGFLPETVFNYLALLGWNPGDEREMFTKDALIQTFSLERVQKSPSIFDSDKLEWLNGMHLRQLSAGGLYQRVVAYGEEFGESAALVLEDSRLKKSPEAAVALVQNRMRKLSDFFSLVHFIVELPEYEPILLVFKKSDIPTTKSALQLAEELLHTILEREFSRHRLEHYFSHLIAQQGLSSGAVLHPLRVAVTGLKDSPGPYEAMEVLGKKETLRRVNIALQKIRKL